MREIVSNPYIKVSEQNGCYNTLNSYLFNESVIGREVGAEYFLMSIWDLLAMLKFDFQFCGFKYLARLIKYYLVGPEYSEAQAITKISEYYGTNSNFVVASIRDCIRLNKEFKTLAAHYLNAPIRSDCTDTIGGVVDIVAALFITYYNLDTDRTDKSDERSVAINIDRIYAYGKK